MIKYLGSKRVLVPTILALVAELDGVRSVLDLFSGTSRVGHALKRAGYRVVANDHNAYAATIARCYVEADDTLAPEAERLLAELRRLPGRAGYFTQTFCVESRFFQPKNGERIDAIRARIAALALPPTLEAVLLTSLMEAADRVDSTTGVQMAYLKRWAPRAHHDLALRLPELLPGSPHGPGRARQDEAIDAADEEVDLAYLDPPYNQHRYHGNYHVWETLVRGDAPETYGVAKKRIDARQRRSPFNSRVDFAAALSAVLERVRARHLILSFNDEGFLARPDAEAMLGRLGRVRVVERDHKRYVGAQIGIFNPAGDKVGEVSHLRNTELLYVVSR
jgi:adenine-specific DNA-methyltransferase